MGREKLITLLSAGTPFLDGFSTATAAFLISLIPGISPLETAYFTSLYFLGSLIGALIFGRLSDRYGRKRLYVTAMALVVVGSVLAVVSPLLVILLVMRLLSGIALGGDYPVAQAMVTESVSPKSQAQCLAVLMLGWYFGAGFGVLFAIPFVEGLWSWKGILVGQALIAAGLFIGRCFIKESPHWQRIGKKWWEERRAEEVLIPTLLRQLAVRKSFFFCIGFWLCQTIPATILMLYGASILSHLTGTNSPFLQMLLLYGFFLVGALLGAMQSVTSRPRVVLVATFAGMAVSFAGIFLSYPQYPVGADLCFIGFAIAYGLQTPLDFIYPNLLFPTQIRGTFVGTITAVSRLGTAGAAFAYPLLADAFPITVIWLGCCVILVLGAVLGLLVDPPISSER